MNTQEEAKLFTDLGGRFLARLSAVYAARGTEAPSETTGISSKYQCQVKAEYQKELMGLLEEGMLLAVRNFKSSSLGPKRFSLLEVSRLGPEHYGLRGLTDQSYYPYQFEIIQQSVQDWDTDDKSTMMIQMSSIPLNYDLVLDGEAGPEYVKGFTYPVIGERVSILSRNTIHQMYNKTILEKMGRQWQKIDTTSNARLDPRLGTIKMFESEKERIPIYVDFERLVRYHFGIFGFTGCGKSNLLSNILRRLVLHSKDTKVVIFDISMEYPFLLLDLLSDAKVPSKIILESPVSTAEQLYKIVVKPRGFEKNTTAEKSFEAIMKQERVGHFAEARSSIPTFDDILHQLDLLEGENAERVTSLEAIDVIRRAILGYIGGRKQESTDPMDAEFVGFLSKTAVETVEKYKIWKSGSLYTWAETRDTLKDRLSETDEPKVPGGYDTKAIADLIEGEERLVCLSIVDPNLIKSLAIDLSQTVLMSRKREFKVEPLVLFVFDETQEFIPAYDKARGIERECTLQVETLLRQGRKYGLGCCLATQRIAYLNTNALQQLHTYFVGPMPRPYDRSLVSNTFTIDQGILEKTLEFAPGEWLLSSYIATGMENVPIFIKADNVETEIEQFVKT
ncbi:MAG: ATP-binding protein [archaeon]